jgi:L-lactate utilization protein LutB
LWDLRQKRDREMHGIAEWEELRALASAIKEHTLIHLDQYLEQFEANARSNGIHVHWAKDAAEHNQIVHGILSDHGAKLLIKSKSMLTEECGFRHYMASVGIEVIETDLGERIQQLDNEDPSHVVVPAVHKLRTDVYSNLPFASTLNGSCSNVCPVKINIHEQIYAWRRELVKRHEVAFAKKTEMKAAGELLSRPAAYRAAIAAANVALAHLPQWVIYNGLNAWGRHREVPHPPKQTFHSWYQTNRGEKK